MLKQVLISFQEITIFLFRFVCFWSNNKKGYDNNSFIPIKLFLYGQVKTVHACSTNATREIVHCEWNKSVECALVLSSVE